MPFSFIDIEEKKTRLIGFLLFFIVAFYFVTAYLILLVVKNSLFASFYGKPSGLGLPTARETLIVLGVALLIGFIHWASSTSNLISRLSVSIGAGDVDPKDTYL